MSCVFTEGMIWSITMPLGCADESLPDGALRSIANQILGGLRGLDAALDVFLSVSWHDPTSSLCATNVNNPASAPLVSLLVLFLGKTVDLVTLTPIAPSTSAAPSK